MHPWHCALPISYVSPRRVGMESIHTKGQMYFIKMLAFTQTAFWRLRKGTEHVMCWVYYAQSSLGFYYDGTDDFFSLRILWCTYLIVPATSGQTVVLALSVKRKRKDKLLNKLALLICVNNYPQCRRNSASYADYHAVKTQKTSRHYVT